MAVPQSSGSAPAVIHFRAERVPRGFWATVLEIASMGGGADPYEVVAINRLGQQWIVRSELDRYAAEVVVKELHDELDQLGIEKFGRMHGMPSDFAVQL